LRLNVSDEIAGSSTRGDRSSSCRLRSLPLIELA